MRNTSFSFEITSKDSKTKARTGIIHTPHGDIQTPAFVAVGTQATVKSLSPEELKEIGVELLFGNTYHLYLRPGADIVKDFGGLAQFMNWKGPTITDSGGFQVFSLGKVSALSPAARSDVMCFFPSSQSESRSPAGSNQAFLTDDNNATLVRIKEDKVVFRSHLDGSLHEFTPEKSIQIQQKLGADIILCFDECAPHPSTHKYTKEAMERTHSWAKRSLEEFKKVTRDTKHATHQALYGIVQGGVYENLRKESAQFISSLPFDGIAIGGVSVGESKVEMKKALEWSTPYLPDEKPKHLLGIGEIDDIFAGVEYGMDTFDCVIPTRFGRYGILFVHPSESEQTGKYRIDLNRTKYAKDKGPVAKNCLCKVCQSYTRGYLHHLYKANELLAYRLGSYHNMYFLVHLVKTIRESIFNNTFNELKKEWISH